ncbi:MAG: hypothetical protein L6Q95_06530 [Planctomycetes bacterium]|nr:hypothetical protein [Planctomycetota bacterium]
MEQRDVRPDTAVLERPGPATAPRGPAVRPAGPTPDQVQKSQGVRDLIAGATLIGIGFLFGGSIFQGNPTILDWIFDGLGIFWISKGIYLLATANSKSAV